MNFKVLLTLITNTLFCNCLQMNDNEFEDIRIFSIGDNPRPSPINLVRSSMITKRSWAPPYFTSEHSSTHEFKKILRAEGLDVTFDFDTKKPRIYGGILQLFTYEFEKLFFHWGKNSTNEHGSYHTLEGEYFPMELQAYYTMIPPPIGELFPPFIRKEIQHSLVISQFFELDSMDNSIIEIILKGSQISIDKLIPPLHEYVTYKGSFVTKPFTENVKWMISLKPQKISKAQLNEFRKMDITENSRAIQPLYGRKVYYVISSE